MRKYEHTELETREGDATQSCNICQCDITA